MKYLENDKDKLWLIRGVHRIDIYNKVEFNGQRMVAICCEDFGDNHFENENGYYYPTVEDIDKIITKLQSSKEFLLNNK